MNAFAFILAAVLFVFLSFFVYMNYPKRWKESKSFRTVLLLWHIVGLASIVTIFTWVRLVPHENLRYEICRLATFYYIPLTLMAILYLILQVYSRAYRFIIKYTVQVAPCPRGRKLSSWTKSFSPSSLR